MWLCPLFISIWTGKKQARKVKKWWVKKGEEKWRTEKLKKDW
jgi:hypothetical protein